VSSAITARRRDETDVLLLLLVMPVALLVMLCALERYERLIVADTRPPADNETADLPSFDVAQQPAPERTPGFATEVA
jgi:hypothetical protein